MAESNLLFFISVGNDSAYKSLKREYPSLISNIDTFCRRDVGIVFGKESLEKADIIIVLKDSGSKTPRGFMTVKTHKLSWALKSSSNTEDGVYFEAPGYLYIDLICSAEASKVRTRSNKKSNSGIILLKELDKFMRASPDFFAIGLRAIPTVISLYSKYGWEFTPSCDREVRNQSRVKEAINHLKRASMSKTINSNKNAQKALMYLKRFLPGRLRNHTRLETQIETRNAFEQGYNPSGTDEVYQTDLSDDGYPMVYCETTPSVLNPERTQENSSAKRRRTAPGRVKSKRKRRKQTKKSRKTKKN